jgi:hypothetical protein
VDAVSAPRHPQLMDPVTDVELFIAASVYWYPLLFPTRTEVLDHTMLCGGNGYEWGDDGNLRSVFAHIEPDYGRLEDYLSKAAEEDAKEARHDPPLPAECSMAVWYREQHAELSATRADYLHRARTYGPVRASEQVPGEGNGHVRQARVITSRDLAWTLLGRMPENVTPAWRRIADETRELFAVVLTEQGQLF